ncbi:MAG: CsgG/HfaB family protein [Geminicoccaceae bacterium]
MRGTPSFRSLLLAGSVFLLFGCDPNPPLIMTAAPTSVETTATYEALRNMPAPKQPVPVAVYSYPDLTGQFKAAETVSTNSRAVTQGAVWMLVKSLKDAAAGRWFKVIQRANLDNLLKERQIIRETRGRVEKQTGNTQPGLPSLLFAGVILEGGIIGYDSNTVTGGIGARYLGIGGDTQYRQDTVSVYLNAISSQTGEVMKSVMTRKTVVSYGARGSVFKFVSFQKLLEAETGYTVNEPGQIALAQAIEHAVRSLIIEGALDGHWQFEDEITGKEATQAYLEDKEDDLLIGDASSGIAQTLLTEDQLEKVAVARKARRQRLEEQALRRQERQLAEQRRKIAEQKKLAAFATPPKGSEASPKTSSKPEKIVGVPMVEQPSAKGDRHPDTRAKQGQAAASITPEQLKKLIRYRQAAAVQRQQEETAKAGSRSPGKRPTSLTTTVDAAPETARKQGDVPVRSSKPADVRPVNHLGPALKDDDAVDEPDEASLERFVPKLKPAAQAAAEPNSTETLSEPEPAVPVRAQPVSAEMLLKLAEEAEASSAVSPDDADL